MPPACQAGRTASVAVRGAFALGRRAVVGSPGHRLRRRLRWLPLRRLLLARFGLLPGMPPPLDPEDVYAATRNGLAPGVRDYPELIYVSNGAANTVSVVDPKTAKVIGTYRAGKVPQHVVPSYDLKTLWVNSSGSNTLTEMDPATGKVIETISVDDPDNLSFTPAGKDAVVMAERLRRRDDGDRTRRSRSARPDGPPAARPLLARAHRHPALSRRLLFAACSSGLCSSEQSARHGSRSLSTTARRPSGP